MEQLFRESPVFAILCVIVLLCFIGFLIQRLLTYAKLRATPVPFVPLDEKEFDVSDIYSYLTPIPAVTNSLFHVRKNYHLLNEHLSYLKKRNTDTKAELGLRIQQFKERHAMLRHHKLQLVRHIFQAKKVIAPYISTLKKITLTIETDSPLWHMNHMAKVSVPSARRLSKKHGLGSFHPGMRSARYLSTQGGFFKQIDIFGKLSHHLTLLLFGMGMVSRLRRVAEEMHGSVANALHSYTHLAEELKLLDTNHNVALSQQFKHLENEIIIRVQRIASLPKKSRFQELDTEMQHTISELYLFVLEVHALNRAKI